MSSDNHKLFQEMIDETLASGSPVHEDRSLREHLQSCAVCEAYLNTSARAIASLAGFSFEVDSVLHARVSAALSQRAQQLEAVPLSGRRWAFACIGALVLTLAGMLCDLQFSRLMASLFDVSGLHVHQGLLSFWIVPSIAPVLLFLLLPLLSRQKERAL
jgi:predicted anti-sigma-YlaC factor YlaD